MAKQQKRKTAKPSRHNEIVDAAVQKFGALAGLTQDEWTVRLHGHEVNQDRHHACEEFIRYCRAAALAETKTKAQPDGGYFLGELLGQVARAVAELVEGGHVWLLRDLAGVIDRLEIAGGPLARAMSRQPSPKRRTALELMKEFGPRDVMRVLHSLHEEDNVSRFPTPANQIWGEVVANRDEAKAELLLQEAPHLCGSGYLSEFERKLIEILPEEKQRNWLLNHHAHAIEMVYDMDFERHNLATFAECLNRGWLWNNGFTRCPWFGRNAGPTGQEVIGFLKEATGDNPRRLVVFRYWLARRKSVFAGESLADDKPAQVWNQIGIELRKKFARLEGLKAKKSAAKPKKRIPA